MKAWSKNKGGKLDKPNPVKTPKGAIKRLKKKKPEQR